ncbi:glycosyltransferase family 2 protein [Vibrio vulnificus]|uniref:glycosyltransferase family 2 protein n=1 Tax=Vibrio vulnificus TaxID=672 RepID=UPI0028A40EB4|nr:glycosyltransferase family 2 protein [Vibrio vulnificus]
MNIDKPLISVIMPAFNAEKTISYSIQSVIDQSFQDWELIICDDSSTDNTTSIVEQFSDVRIKLTTNTGLNGAAHARNAAISLSKGRFIAFLDSDDLWHPEKLKTQYQYMVANNLAFSYGDYHVFSEQSNLTQGAFYSPPTISYESLKCTCSIGCLTVMFDTMAFDSIFMETMHKEDYATWLRFFKEFNPRNGRYPGILAYYRIGQSSLSSNKFHEVKKQFFVLRKITKESRVKCVWYLLHYVTHGIKKHFFCYKH